MSHVEMTIPMLQSTFFPTNLRREPGWQPTVLLSSPGIGKTEVSCTILRALIAEHHEIPVDRVAVVICKPAERDAAELAGVALPYPNESGEFETRFSVSPVIQEIRQKFEEGALAVLLVFDELAAARDPEQKAVSGAFDRSKSLGATELPENVYVIGTGNRAADKSGAARLLSHLTNRVKVLHLRFSMSAWASWARGKGINEIGIECAEAHQDNWFAEVVPVEDGPYCTPRSYVEALADLDAYMESPEFTGTVSPTMERMLACNIGADKASVLCQYIAQRDHVPNAEDILRDPHGATVPDQTGFQMIAAHVAMGAVKDEETAVAVFHYIERLRTDLHVSLCVKLLTMSAENGWVITDPAASAFISQYHELLPLVH